VSASSDERDAPLRRTVDRFLRRRPPAGAPAGGAPWGPGFFALDRVARFREANPRDQAAVLAACADGLLAESWFIERCGVAFCAKMILLAENPAEQRVFALVGADEATHAAWLDPWIADQAREVDPFNRFIAGLVEAGSAQPLAFLLQVVLEGFGIVHYKGMAANCNDGSLAATLGRMAEDEALHYAAGIAAFRAARLSAPEKRFLADGACTFLHMLRSGPQAVVAALDRTIGVGNQSDVMSLFDELAADALSADKLNRLRRLMAQPGMQWLIEELEDKGVFTPCNAAECARIYAELR
jgi:hypothetical protein